MVGYTDTQVMMTLAALAATGATERPSGEARDAQAARILRGINAQLAKGNLATGNSWTAIWVGLTDSRANLAYLAFNTSNGAYALALRGTMAGSPIDSSEDMQVGLMLLRPRRHRRQARSAIFKGPGPSPTSDGDRVCLGPSGPPLRRLV